MFLRPLLVFPSIGSSLIFIYSSFLCNRHLFFSSCIGSFLIFLFVFLLKVYVMCTTLSVEQSNAACGSVGSHSMRKGFRTKSVFFWEIYSVNLFTAFLDVRISLLTFISVLILYFLSWDLRISFIVTSTVLNVYFFDNTNTHFHHLIRKCNLTLQVVVFLYPEE